LFHKMNSTIRAAGDITELSPSLNCHNVPAPRVIPESNKQL